MIRFLVALWQLFFEVPPSVRKRTPVKTIDSAKLALALRARQE